MFPSSAKIYVGGWARFREESGATRKEFPEDFSWMGEQDIVGAVPACKFASTSDRTYYEDCRDALARVEGAKEWLTASVGVEEGSGTFNFQDDIGKRIVLDSGHSGNSWCGMMWSYRGLLNGWDAWVLAQKEKEALREYKNIQVPDYVFSRLSGDAAAVLAGHSHPTEESVKTLAAQWGFQGSLGEISEMASSIHLENQEHNEKKRMKHEEEKHCDLLGGVKWKYKYPSRWFDTPYGSSIRPRTPYEVTGRVIQEMEAKHPEYRQHLQRVTAAMAEYRATYEMYDTNAKMELFLKKWSFE